MKVTTQRTSKKLKLLYALSVGGIICGVFMVMASHPAGLAVLLGSVLLWFFSRLCIWWFHA